MRVLVTGITGQDGSYMCDYLLENVQCEVIGIVRRTSNPTYDNCKHVFENPKFTLVYGDLADQISINEIVSKYILMTPQNSTIFVEFYTPHSFTE